MAKLMKFLCFEPYDEITGSKEFIRSYYPKMIHLVGSGVYRNNGTFVLGTAEGGLKITMYFVSDFNAISGSEYVTDAWSSTWNGDADAQAYEDIITLFAEEIAYPFDN